MSKEFITASPVTKNGEYIADIIGIGHEGEGVGRVDLLIMHLAKPSAGRSRANPYFLVLRGGFRLGFSVEIRISHLSSG